MATQPPMGASGVELDPQTRKPKTPEQRQVAALEKATKIHAGADDLWKDLHLNSATLKALLVEYQMRLEELAKADPICTTIQRIVKTMRFKLELAPKMAEREARRLAGGALMTIVDSEPAP